MKEILKKNTKKLAIWTVAWVGTLAFLSGGVNNLWDSLLITKIGLLINFAIGIGMIIANKNLFNHYDELQRKIHLEALALTLGLTVVVGISYEVSFDLGIINSEPETEYLILFISFSYIVSVLLNSRRYK
jgi:hypothetical protein